MCATLFTSFGSGDRVSRPFNFFDSREWWGMWICSWNNLGSCLPICKLRKIHLNKKGRSEKNREEVGIRSLIWLFSFWHLLIHNNECLLQRCAQNKLLQLHFLEGLNGCGYTGYLCLFRNERMETIMNGRRDRQGKSSLFLPCIWYDHITTDFQSPFKLCSHELWNI